MKKRLENQIKCLRDVKEKNYERPLYVIRKWKISLGLLRAASLDYGGSKSIL